MVDAQELASYIHYPALGFAGTAAPRVKHSLHGVQFMYRRVFGLAFPLTVVFVVMVTPTYASSASKPVPIKIKDKCDPVTFNAAVGVGACVGHGGVTFARFLDEVVKHQSAPQWQFAPSQRRLNVGQTFEATNEGGETHTFTEVEKFGGGIVPLLNQDAGFSTFAPECTDGSPGGPFGFLKFAPPAQASIVAPGGTFRDTESADDVGHPVLYQCCIHPWMHEVLTVEP